MKRIISIFFTCFVAIAATAQNKAEIEVDYDWTYFNRSGKEITHTMTLLAGNESSKFYYKPGEYVDSMRATPEREKQYMEAAMAYMMAGNMSSYPTKAIYLYVVKNLADSVVRVYDGLESGEEYKFKYDEPLESQEWTIVSDSTTSILGYECVKATGSWRGRNWNVWFSPEIPLDNGPWKLCGLPGLILKAEDSTGQHRFVATGIMTSHREIIPFPGKYTYEKINRANMLKILRKHDEDPVGAMKANSDGFAGYHSTPISDKCDFLETDYH